MDYGRIPFFSGYCNPCNPLFGSPFLFFLPINFIIDRIIVLDLYTYRSAERYVPALRALF